MLPEAPFPGSPADWLRYARADLAFAAIPLPPGGLYSILCFHAQQVVEKSLKAVLIHRAIEPPRVHALSKLLDLLPADVEPTHEVVEATELTRFAVGGRYPNLPPMATEADYREAIAWAEAVLAWAETIIATTPGEYQP